MHSAWAYSILVGLPSTEEKVRNDSTSKQASYAVLTTTAIQKANTAGDASRGYITGDEWNKATVASGIVTKTKTTVKETNGQNVVTTSTISQSTLGVVVAATANVATVTVTSVSSITPVSTPVVTQEPAAIDKSKPVKIASLPVLDGPGEAAVVSKPIVVEESCKVPPVSEEITTSSNKEDNSNSLGYTSAPSLPNLTGMPDFSWAQKMLDDSVGLIGKYYAAVMSGPWYSGYNVASGEDFVTGEELSTTQRVIDGVGAAAYFLPEIGEVGEAAASIGEVEGAVVREAEQLAPEVESAISTSIEGTGEVAQSAGKPIFENGKVSIDALKSNPTAFQGKSVDEVAQMLKNEGYDVTVQASDKSRSGAKIIKINNTGEGRNITQVQVSPGGGRHGASPYVKVSTSDQGIIKVVDGAESAYKTDGNETATIIFTGRE